MAVGQDHPVQVQQILTQPGGVAQKDIRVSGIQQGPPSLMLQQDAQARLTQKIAVRQGVIVHMLNEPSNHHQELMHKLKLLQHPSLMAFRLSAFSDGHQLL